jgi:hypothetical protein
LNDRKQCEFHLIRYVPDAVRDEFVNIGVLLRDAGGAETPMIRMTRDWARVRCADPEADTEMLEALEQELRARLLETPAEGTRPLMGVIEDSFSNLVQVTDAKGYLAESMITGVEELMRVYVESRKLERARRVTGRARIQSVMRSQFERAGVWELMRKRIAAAAYTRAGDCGYRPNGVIRMFHAVSLEAENEVAKVLAFSMPALREGVARIEGAMLEMTAVVEPVREVMEEEAREYYRFAVDTMEGQAIRVMTTADLGRMAETARRELLRG